MRDLRLVLVSHHAPRRNGTASGRMAFALVEALREEGHDATAWCWGAEPPDLPSWADWRPPPHVASARVRARSLIRPRSDSGWIEWTPPEDALVIADDTISFAAAGRAPHAVANIHNSLALDRAALGGRRAADVQDLRAERRVVRRASHVWTSSPRVLQALGRGVVVPYTLPLPERPVPQVQAPVVGMLADWSWRPNVVALGSLLESWHQVRAQVPGARLILAGRGRPPVGPAAGVVDLGEVPTSADLLAEVAVLAFPCPPTSGAKMKSFDALAHGVALLTTAAGAEGLPEGAAQVAPAGPVFTQALVALLLDGGARQAQAERGRRLVLEHHSPRAAARARLAVLGEG